jgi:hypothetical protein
MKKFNLKTNIQLNFDQIDKFLDIVNDKLKNIINNNENNNMNTIIENNNIIENNIIDDKKLLNDMNNSLIKYQNNSNYDKYSSNYYHNIENNHNINKKYSKNSKIFYDHIMKNDLVLICKLYDYMFYFDYDKNYLDKNKIFIYSDGKNICNHVSYCTQCALLVYENLIKKNSLIMCIKCNKIYDKFILLEKK